MLIEKIADLLQTLGIGTVGTNIFLMDITTQPSNGIYLTNTPSTSPNQAIEIYEQSVDFWSRNDSVLAGYNKLKAIQDELNKRSGYDMGDYRVYISYSTGMIDDMGDDSQNRKIQKLSINFIYTPAIGT